MIRRKRKDHTDRFVRTRAAKNKAPRKAYAVNEPRRCVLEVRLCAEDRRVPIPSSARARDQATQRRKESITFSGIVSGLGSLRTDIISASLDEDQFCAICCGEGEEKDH